MEQKKLGLQFLNFLYVLLSVLQHINGENVKRCENQRFKNIYIYSRVKVEGGEKSNLYRERVKLLERSGHVLILQPFFYRMFLVTGPAAGTEYGQTGRRGQDICAMLQKMMMLGNLYEEMVVCPIPSKREKNRFTLGSASPNAMLHIK